MKQIIILFLFITSAIGAESVLKADPQKGIEWLTNYEQAVTQAKGEQKPIILFFTGSDWCSWCNKLEEEVFEKSDFSRLVGHKFIFVKLDFPLYKSEPPEINAQNKQLQKKHQVRSYPTIVMLDHQSLEQIGTTGYRPGGPKQFAAHLEKLANSFSIYKQKISMLHSDPLMFSASQLHRLYVKAKEFNLQNDMTYLLTVGIDAGFKDFFLAEKYRALADEGLIHSKEASALKQQLQTMDPQSTQQLHYEIALIEFETFSEEMHRNHYSPELAIAPLVNYIEKYGESDKQNLWRLEMIISQVYLDRDRLSDALKHAQASYRAAPAPVQTQLATAIKSLQMQIALLQ